MLSVLDDSIGNLTAALKASGMYNNTIIVFTTDNGGPVDGFSLNYASNFPLRSVNILISYSTHKIPSTNVSKLRLGVMRVVRDLYTARASIPETSTEDRKGIHPA